LGAYSAPRTISWIKREGHSGQGGKVGAGGEGVKVEEVDRGGEEEFEARL